MASNAVIGALRVVLGADTAALESGLKDASSQLAAFGASIAKVGAVAGAGFAAAATAIAAKLNGVIEEADQLNKASQSIGLPVEQLSKLKYAADLSDVSFEALGVSLGKLSKNMIAFAGGASGPASEAFKAIGVSVVDANGKLRSSGDVLADIAEKFKGYEDSAAKTALAIALFGKAGASMVPLLNQGRDGLRQATDEAERYGIVIDSKTAVAAESFNDNLKRMSEISRGVWVQVAAQVTPAFERLSQIFLESKENGGLMKVAVDGLVAAIKASIQVVLGAVVVYQQVGRELNALWAVLTAPNWDAMKAAWTNWISVGEQTKERLANIQGEVEKLFSATPDFNWSSQFSAVERMDSEVEKLGQTWTKTAAPIIQAADSGKNALQSFIDSTKKRKAALEAEAQTIGMSRFETDKLRIALEGEQVAKNANIPPTDALKAKLDALGVAYAAMSEKAQFAKQLFDQTRTPLEQYQSAIEDLNGAYQRGSIDADLYARGVAQAQQRFVEADPYAQAFGSSLTSAFDKAIQGGSKFSDVLKGLLQDLSRALANQAFKSLLFGDKGGTSGGVFGGLFGGIGNLFGFADGGSFQVGGSGGIDSQLVAFRASPNERVSVTKPGQGMDAMGITYAPTYNVAQGADPQAIAELRAAMVEDRARFSENVIKIYRDARSRRVV